MRGREVVQSSLQGVVELVRRHPAAHRAAQFGYATSAVVHLLICATALRLAFSSTRSPAHPGPLRQLVGTAGGGALLWLIVGGLGVLALWQIVQMITVTQARKRLRSLGRIVVYALLCATAAGVAEGGGEHDDDLTAEEVTATLMREGLGLVVLAGLSVVILAVGAYHLVRGARATFLRDLPEHPVDLVVMAGRAGYIAKGAALTVVGGLLGSAVVLHEPDRPQGLDAALAAVLAIPLGPFLLTLVGLGFAGYAIYAGARARYAWC